MTDPAIDPGPVEDEPRDHDATMYPTGTGSGLDRAPAPGTGTATGVAPADDRSIGTLLRDLASESRTLARQEVDLVRAETNEAFQDIKIAAGEAIVAAVVAMAGLGVLLMAIAYLLATFMPLWLGTLIVAILALILAAVLVGSAKNKASAINLAPTRTQRTVERGQHVAAEAVRD